jgi:hypothetical protein
MPEVVNCVHDVGFWIVTILHGDDIIEMSVNILASVPTMESDWMKLLGDLGDQEHLIEDIINVFNSVISLEDCTCHVDNSIRVWDVIVFDKSLTCKYLIIF